MFKMIILFNKRKRGISEEVTHCHLPKTVMLLLTIHGQAAWSEHIRCTIMKEYNSWHPSIEDAGYLEMFLSSPPLHYINTFQLRIYYSSNESLDTFRIIYHFLFTFMIILAFGEQQYKKEISTWPQSHKTSVFFMLRWICQHIISEQYCFTLEAFNWYKRQNGSYNTMDLHFSISK